MDVFQEAVRRWAEQDKPGAIEALAPALDARVVMETRFREALDHRNQGRHEDAMRILQLAFRDAGGGTQLGETLHHMGTTLQGKKRYPEALEALRAAFLVRELAGDGLGAAYSAFQIPMCHLVSGTQKQELLGEFAKARERILDIVDKQGQDLELLHLGNLWQNVAFCYQMESNFSEALSGYGYVLELREQVGDARGRAMTQARIAECQLDLGCLEDAKRVAQETLAFFREIYDRNRIAQVEQTLQAIQETRDRR